MTIRWLGPSNALAILAIIISMYAIELQSFESQVQDSRSQTLFLRALTTELNVDKVQVDHAINEYRSTGKITFLPVLSEQTYSAGIQNGYLGLFDDSTSTEIIEAYIYMPRVTGLTNNATFRSGDVSPQDDERLYTLLVPLQAYLNDVSKNLDYDSKRAPRFHGIGLYLSSATVILAFVMLYLSIQREGLKAKLKELKKMNPTWRRSKAHNTEQ